VLGVWVLKKGLVRKNKTILTLQIIYLESDGNVQEQSLENKQ